MNNSKIRVLIVDDSALVRKLLTRMLEQAPDIEVIGTAPDPYVAREKIKQLNPDVLTLDVEMPRMDGLTFLRNIMRLRPMPVIMISSLTEKGADVTLDALELGVVDFVTKPRIDLAGTLESYTEEIQEKVRVAACARVGSRSPLRQRAVGVVAPRLTSDAVLPQRQVRHLRTTDRVIVIGASTGGTEAIKEVLLGLPADGPGVLIAQHIPPKFSAAFAERMNRMTSLVVKEAEDGDQVRPGHAYVAPGNRHLLLERDGARYVCRLNDGPPVNRHRPSVDVLFRSVAQAAGPNAAAVILTGMGNDGAAGLLELRDSGAHTIAQDEATSVVWGMPGEAVKHNAAVEVLPVNAIAGALLSDAATQVRTGTRR